MLHPPLFISSVERLCNAKTKGSFLKVNLNYCFVTLEASDNVPIQIKTMTNLPKSIVYYCMGAVTKLVTYKANLVFTRNHKGDQRSTVNYV